MKKFKGLDCILLVDDDEVTNYLNKVLIKKSGIDVHVEVALNGEIALEYLTSTGKYSGNNGFPKPGLIFLDINMPRMNGWEFVEEYSKLDSNKKADIVIAMLTSSNNDDDVNTALEKYELPAYLYKPLTLEKLEEIISKFYPVEV
ncbi:response regulator [Maribellus maritimus]|uniref:response regulator n=1 Tax=Maribellus maritimus TaxID=2870838 RepID=UPI001EEAC85E|nr:response regulator [Maribellus maritimus]MCG6187034.1 response regulator [Maribellus maritimus]